MTEKVEYGVNVSNKFAALEDDGDLSDPEELVRRLEEEAVRKAAEAAKAAKKAAAAAAKAPAAVTAPARAAEGKENQPLTPGSRGGAPRGRGGAPRGNFERADRGPRPPRQDGGAPREFSGRGRGGRGGARGGGTHQVSDGDDNAPLENANQDGERPPRSNFSGRGGRGGRGGASGRIPSDNEAARCETLSTDSIVSISGSDALTGGRGGGGFRGGRGGRGGRQFDRQSGDNRTGIKPVDKKEGHGRGNWGTESDELVAADNRDQSLNNDTHNESKEEVEPLPPREKTEEELAREAELEALSKQKTLSEFKAEQKKEDAKFNIRTVTDDQSFGKLKSISKPKAGDEHGDGDDEEEITIVRSSKTKPLNVDFKFQTRGGGGGGERGGGYRGGRGGDRGERGGGGRGGGGSRRDGGNAPPPRNYDGEQSSGRGARGGAGGGRGGRGGGGYSGGGAGGGRGGAQSSNQVVDTLANSEFPALGAH